MQTTLSAAAAEITKLSSRAPNPIFLNHYLTSCSELRFTKYETLLSKEAVDEQQVITQ